MVHQLSSETKTTLHHHLLRGIAESHIILDERYRIQSMNITAANLLGYDAAALISYAPDIWWSDGPLILANIDSKTAVPHTIHTQVQRANQALLPVSMAITPMKTLSETEWLLSLVPMEQAQHLNAAFAHTQRLAGVGTLTSSVSHELTNPISIINATCSNLLLDIQNGDNTLSRSKLLQYIQTIEQSANRTVRIMEVLRNYSLQDSLQSAVTNLNLIIDDALTLVSHQFAQEYNITVTTELSPDLKSLVCDHSRITQLLINLLINARDSMLPAGGNICIKSWIVPPEDEPPMRNGLTQAQVPTTYYAFSVSDTGQGIPPQMLERIFDLFFTTKTNGSGTGLGLFICQGIVQQHNGRIQASNNADQGATFTVVLPRRL